MNKVSIMYSQPINYKIYIYIYTHTHTHTHTDTHTLTTIYEQNQNGNFFYCFKSKRDGNVKDRNVYEINFYNL
jgi:hypothetical protein